MTDKNVKDMKERGLLYLRLVENTLSAIGEKNAFERLKIALIERFHWSSVRGSSSLLIDHNHMTTNEFSELLSFYTDIDKQMDDVINQLLKEVDMMLNEQLEDKDDIDDDIVWIDARTGRDQRESSDLQD